ncbi:MAG: hypothetical protein FJ304_04880 [Planctomycetes bacterium]|nr:hypothetical protein [Planctomycetota bacterium]
MTPATYHGVVRGGAILLEAPAPLPDGTEVLVTPTTEEAARRGHPTALLAALKVAPAVPAEWVDELEALIEQGRRPPA